MKHWFSNMLIGFLLVFVFAVGCAIIYESATRVLVPCCECGKEANVMVQRVSGDQVMYCEGCNERRLK